MNSMKTINHNFFACGYQTLFGLFWGFNLYTTIYIISPCKRKLKWGIGGHPGLNLWGFYSIFFLRFYILSKIKQMHSRCNKCIYEIHIHWIWKCNFWILSMPYKWRYIVHKEKWNGKCAQCVIFLWF